MSISMEIKIDQLIYNELSCSIHKFVQIQYATSECFSLIELVGTHKVLRECFIFKWQFTK